MSTADSLKLWENRFKSRKLSGLKVTDWCEQNNISTYAYYYWHSKLNHRGKQEEPLFVEVSPVGTGTIPTQTYDTSEIVIAWNDFSITVTNQQAIPMAADLLRRLAEQC